jgi:hypothetical protein
LQSGIICVLEGMVCSFTNTFQQFSSPELQIVSHALFRIASPDCHWPTRNVSMLRFKTQLRLLKVNTPLDFPAIVNNVLKAKAYGIHTSSLAYCNVPTHTMTFNQAYFSYPSKRRLTMNEQLPAQGQSIADSIKVKFEFTVDDVVDGIERTTGRSPVITRLRFAQSAATCFAAFILSFLIMSGPFTTRLLWALVATSIAIALFRFRVAGSRKRNIRKLFMKQFGGVGPHVCEVEIGPTGVVSNQAGTVTRRDWRFIQSVDETGDAIEFVTRGVGSVIVRNRAFHSKEEWKKFLDLSRQYLATENGKTEQPATSGLT